ncbi:MAG TPA: acyltransferase [Actinophytocola sp.]|nr:acyltransferase [Actinophytocola sp.]
MTASPIAEPAGGLPPDGLGKDKQYAKAHIGFAWLRMVGALVVVLEHSWALIDPENPSLFPAHWHVGDVAILAFFAMSGYQVQASWENDPSWWRFGARRLLRIIPPLAAMLIITSLLVGALFTTLPVGEYYSQGATWQFLLGAFPLVLYHTLPGVFETNFSNYSINPSLWTLPMELVGYAGILVLGVLLAFRVSRWLMVLVVLGLGVWRGIYVATIGDYGAGGYFFDTPLNFMVKFLIAFGVGALLYKFRDRIPVRPLAAIALFAVWVLVNFTIAPEAVDATPNWNGGAADSVALTLFNQYLMLVAAGYGAITLAHHWPKSLERSGRWVMGSYGIFIWAGVIQQSAIALGVSDQWTLLVLSLPLSYLFGLLSWHYVELPTQKLRRFLRAKDLSVPDKPEQSEPAATRG